MGRYYYDAKRTVESANQLSIFKLNQWGYLQHGAGGTLSWTRSLTGEKSTVGISVYMGNEPNVRLYYTVTRPDGEKIDCNYRIWLSWTACRYGGKRYWFTCPGCLNRVGTLYLAGRSTQFQCRRCSDLTYESRNESRLGRFGQIGYPLVAERKYEELYKATKRWTWRGNPTKKTRKLKVLEAKLVTYEDGPSVEALLLGQ